MDKKFDIQKFKLVATLREALPIIESLEKRQSIDDLLSIIQHPKIDIKIEGLKRLQKIGAKKTIPALIEALEQSNRPVMGSEEATLHKIYQKNLCKAICDISGEDYEIKNLSDVREVISVVQTMKDWADKNIEKW